jgi:hypothetical protein
VVEPLVNQKHLKLLVDVGYVLLRETETFAFKPTSAIRGLELSYSLS